MFASPPEDPDDTDFQLYDLKMLLGYGLIAWALAVSIGLPFACS